jgi:hypothetical protein
MRQHVSPAEPVPTVASLYGFTCPEQTLANALKAGPEVRHGLMVVMAETSDGAISAALSAPLLFFGGLAAISAWNINASPKCGTPKTHGQCSYHWLCN